MKNFLRYYTSVFAVALGLVTFSFAQTSPSTEFANVKIKNFGQMDQNFYRGAQPEPDDFKALADLGIKTVIDLRNDPTDYEKAAVEALGMKYVNIPMSGWKNPKDRDLQTFMNLVNDPATGAFYVHCKAGIHRTGVAGYVYRHEKYGWDYDQAYKEMKNYNFSTGWVHGALKDYVQDYSKRARPDQAKLLTAAPVMATMAGANP